MTRVLILLLAISFSSSQNYTLDDLDHLWETYSPFSSNLTLLKDLLYRFESVNNTQSKISEFWLLGLPVQSKNSYKDSDFIKSSKFKRNLDLAVYYLKKSLPTNKDSSFFLNLISQSSLLFEGFDTYVPINGVSQDTLKYYTDKGLLLKSQLTIVSTIHKHQKCSTIQRPPTFLKEKPISFILNPSSSYLCSYSCKDLAYLAIAPATESVEFRHRTKREHIEVPFIGEEDLLTEVRLNSKIKMFEKMIKYRSHEIVTYANYYLQGQRLLGFEPDIESALSLLEKSASFDNIKAHEMLGILYSDGRYFQKNITKALYYLNYAKNKGSALALATLGLIYLYGNNVPKDEELGLKYLDQAMRLGEHSSYSILGEYYFLTRQTIESLRYLPISATLRSHSGMYYYGLTLLQLSDNPSECENVLENFRKVLIDGSLSRYIENGYIMFMNEDYEGAFLNFLVSAALGDDTANLNLAYMFEKDLVPYKFRCKKGKEFCAGWFYYLASKSNKNSFALGKIVANGNEHFEGNILEARSYFEESRNLPESLFEIAKMHEYGLGVSQNLTKAAEIYKKIMEDAEKEPFDKSAKYPAYIAGLRILVKQNESLSSFLSFLFDSSF